MTKAEILEETTNFYNSTNRAMKDGACVYLDDEGNKCAVGRCILPEKLSWAMSLEETTDVESLELSIIEDGGKSLDDILKPEYCGHEFDFWDNLQQFHDTNEFWNENGLTDEGENAYDELTEKYGRCY